jgi:Zn-dependent protease with chaperone function
MFSNFIYFIIALLVYATYQPSDQTNFEPTETIVLFAALTIFFFLFSKRQFKRLEQKALNTSQSELDQQFSSTTTKQSIAAIVLFAADIYGLNLSSFFNTVKVFQIIPTLEALLFMSLFITYLSIVWYNGHGAYRFIYGTHLDRSAYVWSNITLSVPILLPWLLLSGMTDVLLSLPFELPRKIMNTPEGEIATFLVFLLAIALFGPVVIQKFWRCRPLENIYFRKRIEIVCAQAGLRYADILYWPIFGGRMLTAGVMGLVGRFRYILVTKALLQVLNPDEVDAVIAHEVGHVKRHHLLFYLFFFIGYMVIAYATFDLIVYLIIFSEPIYRFLFATGINRTTITTGLLSLAIIVNFLVYFRFLFGYFMRNFERQADAFVYTLFDNALPLISTFNKIVVASGQSPEKPNWHHFSIRERVEFLKQCEVDRSWIKRHDRKVRNSIVVFTVLLVAVSITGYQLKFGQTGKHLNDKFWEAVIQDMISREGRATPQLYGQLGDIYFNRGQFDKAASSYQNALDLDANQVIVLNNYAWLLATCEDPAVHNPAKALQLAQKAASIDKESPYIMDTLAESYYINGRSTQAVKAAATALDLARANRTYYKKQLEKFKAAIEAPAD